MDPISLIVMALASGAAAALKPTATAAVKDTYAAVKALIVRKYGKVGVEAVESKPESQPKRDSLAEDLLAGGADKDEELVRLAEALVAAVQKDDPEVGAALGVDLQDVKAQFLSARRIAASGTGVRVQRAEFSEGITIEDVRAGDGGSGQNP